MKQIIGTCSECAGPVVIYGMELNPIPRCDKCGATKASPHGPIIPMTPKKERVKEDKYGWYFKANPSDFTKVKFQ